MPRQGKTTGEWPAFDLRAVGTLATVSEERLEWRGTMLRKACKCAGTSSTGHVEKSKNASGGVSLSFDPRLRCDICGTAWVSDATGPGI